MEANAIKVFGEVYQEAEARFVVLNYMLENVIETHSDFDYVVFGEVCSLPRDEDFV